MSASQPPTPAVWSAINTRSIAAARMVAGMAAVRRSSSASAKGQRAVTFVDRYVADGWSLAAKRDRARGRRIALWFVSAPFLFGREILCGTHHIAQTYHLRNYAFFHLFSISSQESDHESKCASAVEVEVPVGTAGRQLLRSSKRRQLRFVPSAPEGLNQKDARN